MAVSTKLAAWFLMLALIYMPMLPLIILHVLNAPKSNHTLSMEVFLLSASLYTFFTMVQDCFSMESEWNQGLKWITPSDRTEISLQKIDAAIGTVMEDTWADSFKHKNRISTRNPDKGSRKLETRQKKTSCYSHSQCILMALLTCLEWSPLNRIQPNIRQWSSQLPLNLPWR